MDDPLAGQSTPSTAGSPASDVPRPHMAPFSPHHTAADVDRHNLVFGEAITALMA